MERMVMIDKCAHKEMSEGTFELGNGTADSKEETKKNSEQMSLDNSDDNDKKGDNFADKLDRLMCLMFEYVNLISKTPKLLRELFITLCRIFEKTVLTTIEVEFSEPIRTPIKHSLFLFFLKQCDSGCCVVIDVFVVLQLPTVPFLMFYLCHLRPQFAEEFTSRLLRLCTDTGKPTHERCFAATYVGGFISKAKYLRQASCLVALDILLQWLSGYVTTYCKSNLFNMTMPAKEVVNHQLFYAVCHAAFRIYCRESECLESAIESHPQVPDCLQIVLNSSLQPLKVKFFWFTKHYFMFGCLFCFGIVSCKIYFEEFVTALSQSSFGEKCLPSTRTLSSHFAWLAKASFVDLQVLPFDEYLLPKSKSYLDGLIRANEPKVVYSSFGVWLLSSPLREEEHQDQEMMDNDPLNYLQHTVDPEAALTPSKKGLQEEDIPRENEDDDMPMLNLNENVWDAVRNRKITLDVDTEDDCFMENLLWQIEVSLRLHIFTHTNKEKNALSNIITQCFFSSGRLMYSKKKIFKLVKD
ncbi:RRN3 RNA polymerase I transcription factor -like protein [Reticulomyxa filosa]|uniref:RRN3 RNA polymerase I transcription factor-like protein n=1 Tax=Reticulomyxa filosa TaxID=46433 RepID=X6PD67_RETFI|nr:RRN3 RNA polymerase I transcription factor -like protein [Reticulomyxa filosa]|eukprot:ETO36161.1 RRN3 RNA polymerase I transcription factor -like protein [Reticulomyxa filosa]